MTTKVRRWLKLAKKDVEFHSDYTKFNGKPIKIPNIFTDQTDEHIFVTIYVGWRCGKGYDKLL